MSRAAIISGAAGQDGSYLAEFLLAKGYDVYGVVRYASENKRERIDHIQGLKIIRGDLTDSSRLVTVIRDVAARDYERIEVYNLAAQSHVKVSFEQPEFTANVDALGVLRWLESIRLSGYPLDRFRFYQAGTSEMFGKVLETPQTESTPFYPRSPYGCAKVFGYWITKNYRESYGMYACNGVLFNHESERRGEEFVTRKITKAIGTRQFPIVLGNLDAKRDWGHAQDYVEGMWHIMQQDTPDDYVLSTGETHSVREFVEVALERIGKRIEWHGSGDSEYGTDLITGDVLVRISPEFYRPAEVDYLIGDSTKARKAFGWAPKVSFTQLVHRMVDNDSVPTKV
jgi:GDPmannose 4,6-dehydratase